MAKSSQSGSLSADIFAAAVTVVLASALGLGVNAFSPKPVNFTVAEESEDDPNAPKTAKADRITMHELAELWSKDEAVLLIDARDKSAYDQGHVPHSLHFPSDNSVDQIQNILPVLQGATALVIYCDSDECSKSDKVAELLTSLDFKNVRVLKGGWVEYSRSGFKIETADDLKKGQR